MKSKVNEQLTKIQTILKDENYVPGKRLCEVTGLCMGSVCTAIRKLREQGVGIITTHKGYVLSEFAKKSDDVGFLRRLHGRRASDFIALKAASPDMSKRWNSLTAKQEFKRIVAPLEAGHGLLASGMKALLSTSNSKGV